MQKIESSLVRSENLNRQMEKSITDDIVQALRGLYFMNDVSFKTEYVGANQMIIIVDGFTFSVEVNKIKDEN